MFSVSTCNKKGLVNGIGKLTDVAGAPVTRTRCPVNPGKAKVGRSSDALNSYWTMPQDLMTDMLARWEKCCMIFGFGSTNT